MRIKISILIITVLLAGSCATSKKNKPTSETQNTEDYIPGTTAKKRLMPSTPVEEKKPAAAPSETEREVQGIEKKLVSDDESKISPEKYFVIVGSFREPANARKRQSELEKEGFRSEILKTEEGLYRISVLATDDANEAISEVRRIWLMFPQYSDTWMLISKTLE